MKTTYLLLIVSICLAANGSSANTIDSLLHIIEQKDRQLSLEEEYHIYKTLGNFYRLSNNEDFKKAAYYYYKAFRIAKSKNDIEKITYCHYALGVCFERLNQYQEAIAHYEAVISAKESPTFQNENKADAYSQMANIFQVLGDFEAAYENQMQALSICNIKKDSSGIGKVYYHLGNIFYYQNQYEKALEYYEKSKDIADKLKDLRPIYSCTAALGSVHEKLKDYEQSLHYNQLSLELAQKLNYKTGIAYAMGNIATNQKMIGDFAKAEQLTLQSIALKKEIGDHWGNIGSKIDLAKLYLEWKKPKKAIPLLNETLAACQQTASKSRIPEIYQALAVAHDLLNQPAQALFSLKKYIALKDSLISEKTLEEMGKSKQRFEVREKEHQIALLQKENEILSKTEEIQQQQIYLFAVTTIAFFMFLWWYKSKLSYQNKVNKLLGEKNSLLAEKNEEIFIKNKQLEHSNQDLQQFAYVASHDLKEPLRMINSYTSLIHRRYNDLFDESGKEFLHYVIDAVKRMERLLDDLLDFSRAGTQPAPKDYVSLKDVMIIVEANLRHRLQTLNATLTVHEEKLPKVKAHRTMLIQLLQNLVSNAVKFKGDKAPCVIVDAYTKDKQIIISVADNGIGISKENREKVFEMFRRLHTRDEYEGTGIGLATCKRIVTTWGGDIWVESEEGKGSTFYFSFPQSVVAYEEARV